MGLADQSLCQGGGPRNSQLHTQGPPPLSALAQCRVTLESMAMSLASLVAVPSLKLRQAGLAETTWNQDISWVAVTELEDPQRFLSGGELVLTTGLRLKSAADQRRFVRQAQRAAPSGSVLASASPTSPSRKHSSRKPTAGGACPWWKSPTRSPSSRSANSWRNRTLPTIIPTWNDSSPDTRSWHAHSSPAEA